MTKYVEFNGETHEFPDEASDGAIKNALMGSQGSSSSEKNMPGNNQSIDNPRFRFAKNIAAGLGGTVQDMYNLGEIPVHYLASKISPNLANKIKPSSIDFSKLVGVPGSLTDKLEQFSAPFLVSALFPEGRAAGLRTAGLVKSLAESTGNAAKQKASSLVDYLQPNKSSEQFLSKLSGIQDHNLESNTASLTEKVRNLHNAHMEDALAEKASIPDEQLLFKKNEIPKTVGQIVKEKLAKSDTNFTPEESKYFINNAKFNKAGKVDFRPPVSKNKAPDLTGVQTANKSNYIDKFDELQKEGFEPTSDIKKLHSQFMENPTFKNAESLRQELGDEYGYLRNRVVREEAQSSEKKEAKQYGDLYNIIKKDITENLPSKHSDAYAEFLKKWNENVRPYRENKNIAEVLKDKSKQSSFNSNDIHSFFKEPSPAAQKVSSDLGEAGRNQILYNALIKKDRYGNAQSIVKGLKSLPRSEGYSQYVSPESRAFGEKLSKQIKTNQLLKMPEVLGALGGELLGHPVYGALAGALYRTARGTAKSISRNR